MTIVTTIKRKNKYSQAKEELNAWHGIDLAGHGLVNLSPSLFLIDGLRELYLGHNNLETLPTGISELKSLEILDISHNRLKFIPEALGRIVSLRSLDLSHNLISSCPMELGFLYKMQEFILDGNPLVEPFSSIYATQGGQGVILFCREHHAYLPPLDRSWIDVSNMSGELVSIATYNILAQRCTTSEIYRYVPSWALDWDYRKKLIINEIQKISPDILCVQEIETKAFSEYFRNQLQHLCNYDALFYPKVRIAGDQDLPLADGCAVFWKRHRFTLIEQKCVEFTHIALNDDRFNEKEDIINRNIDKNNIALIVVLEKFTGGQIIIVNCHLFWNPEYPDVKLFQTVILCDEVKKFTEKFPDAALILSGDYNSTRQSAVYELLTLGRICPFNPDFLMYNYAPLTTKGYTHGLKLQDSLRNQNIEFTNFTPTFRGILDYIFYNEALVLMSYLSPMDPDYINKTVGLPSIHLPSDHIIIGARFVMKNKKRK